MLTGCPLEIVELGHSERREHFGESDETVGLGAEVAVRYGLNPLICIGETLAEREAGRSDAVLERQVPGTLAGFSTEQKSAPILFAYEPVWAIGKSGTLACADCADRRQAVIGAVAADVLGRRVPCLYGGSVHTDNCEDLVACSNVDGLFVGRAAWNVEGYLDILAKCAARL